MFSSSPKKLLSLDYSSIETNILLVIRKMLQIFFFNLKSIVLLWLQIANFRKYFFCDLFFFCKICTMIVFKNFWGLKLSIVLVEFKFGWVDGDIGSKEWRKETKIQANPRREEKLECLDEVRSSKGKKNQGKTKWILFKWQFEWWASGVTQGSSLRPQMLLVFLFITQWFYQVFGKNISFMVCFHCQNMYQLIGFCPSRS
jgi:hypothetical protein